MTSYGGGSKAPKGYAQGKMANYTPEQFNLLKQGMAEVDPNSFTYKLAHGDQRQFDEMEAPALKQFSGIQGQMASRFSGMGSGARKSSGFQNTMNQAGSDFAQQLQSNRMGLQKQAIQDLRGMTNDLLNQRPYENYLVKKAEKQGGNWAGAGVEGIKGAGSAFLASGGNPLAAVGGGLVGGYSGYNNGGSLDFSGFKSSASPDTGYTDNTSYYRGYK